MKQSVISFIFIGACLTLSAQALPPSVATGTTVSKAESFSWINPTFEAEYTFKTKANLDFFKWMKETYGMQLEEFLFKTGALEALFVEFMTMFSDGFKPLKTGIYVSNNLLDWKSSEVNADIDLGDFPLRISYKDGSEWSAFDFLRMPGGANKNVKGDTAGSGGSITNPRPVIFDTDWWTDVDDACAIRVLLWAERMGLVDLVGICIDAIKNTSVPSLSAFLNYEGRADLCIGIDKQATDYNGNPPYHSTCIDGWAYKEYTSNDECEDCVTFYRRALASLSQKADIICVGYPNALSRLLDSTADEYSDLSGKELIEQKVGHLWLMAGKYPSGNENNFTRTARSRAAGANICANWPTEITFLGYEVGVQLVCGNTLSTTTGENDLLYKCLVAHGEGAAGRYAWDPMTTLLACLGDTEVAGYSVKVGTNVVDALTGANVFTDSENGKHKYVIMRHPTNYYQYQLNNILEKRAWGYRKLGAQSIEKNK